MERHFMPLKRLSSYLLEARAIWLNQDETMNIQKMKATCLQMCFMRNSPENRTSGVYLISVHSSARKALIQAPAGTPTMAIYRHPSASRRRFCHAALVYYD